MCREITQKIKDKPMICLIITSVFAIATCYPIGKGEQVDVQSNEKHFPNGTVVGKYSYMDKEGNPIQVKYYADDATYGVELKSIRILETSSVPSEVTSYKDAVSNEPDDVLNNVDDVKEFKNDPFEFLNREMKKIDQDKSEKTGPDFEIYYQNELEGPKQCSNEKVRVYFDKERKIRSALSNFEADKFCEQF